MNPSSAPLPASSGGAPLPDSSGGAAAGALPLSAVLAGAPPPARPGGPAFPGHHCGLFEAALMAGLFPQTATLFVGAPSCLYQAELVARRRPSAGAALRWLPLRQEDLVLGCDSLVADAVRQVAAELAPDLLFVVTTCTPGITGLDLPGLLAAVRREGGLRLAAVSTNGFARLGRRQGTRDFLAALAQVMEPAPRRAGTVNLLATRPPGPGAGELTAALAEAGATVHAWIPGAVPALLVAAPAAALNVVLDEAAEPLARAMEERFGTPWVALPHRYHPAEVAAALAAVGDALGADLRPAAARLAAATDAFLAAARARLAGVPCAVGTVEGSRYEAAAFLAELGMIPRFIQGPPAPGERRWAERLLALGHDPLVAGEGGTAVTARLLAATRPQVFVGHAPGELLEAVGAAHCHLNSWWCEPAFAVPRRAAAHVMQALAGAAGPEAAGAPPGAARGSAAPGAGAAASPREGVPAWAR